MSVNIYGCKSEGVSWIFSTVKKVPDQICERDQAIALLPWLLATYTVKQAHREIVSPITTQDDTNHCRYSQSCMAKPQVY